MNNYTIKVTKDAKNDLKLIKTYLMYNLQNADIAEKIMEKLKIRMKSLSTFPERFPVVNDYYLSMHNLRKSIINNYIIFYFVEKDEKIVHIVRIVHNKSDWMKDI